MNPKINRPVSPRNLIARALHAAEQGVGVALVSLVNIEGNAPYPVGSQMLVNERGEFAGQITGGCAESAIAQQAVAAIKQGKSITQRYGLDSPFFDIKLPCGSGIDVFIDASLSVEQLRQIDSKLQHREPVKTQLETDIGTFQQQYLPERRLLLFGQGAILQKLARLAALSGFETLCFVQDEANQQSLLEQDIYSELLNEHGEYKQYCDAHTALGSLFHEHQLEVPILQSALSMPLFYVGALGSTRTHDVRLQALRALGVSEVGLSRVHGPVGFDLNASTPEHIAISILAEIISVIPQEV